MIKKICFNYFIDWGSLFATSAQKGSTNSGMVIFKKKKQKVIKNEFKVKCTFLQKNVIKLLHCV